MNQTQTGEYTGSEGRSDCGVFQPSLVIGFASAVGVWVAWFITHLPWVRLAEQAALPILIAVWVLVAAIVSRPVSSGRRLAVGAVSGLVSAILGLGLVGSRLRVPDAAASLPSPGAVMGGFVALGVVLGVIGVGVGRVFAGACLCGTNWAARFAAVAALAVAPLIFIGGLVTSTHSGMAVPDWPNTYQSNMFLYPLGPRVSADIYLEHSHRLFGTLAGMSVLVLAAWTSLGALRERGRGVLLGVMIATGVGTGLLLGLATWEGHVGHAFACAGLGILLAIVITVRLSPPGSRWRGAWSLALLGLVVLQGYLGGARVVQNQQVLAMIHGILAQLVLAGVAMLWVYMTHAYRDGGSLVACDGARRARRFGTAAMHSLLIQLALGAAYRHFPNSHGLWTHALFAMVVAGAAVVGGFAAGALRPPEPGPDHPLAALCRRLGMAVAVVVGVQFVLGWVAFMVGGDPRSTDAPVQALVRTAHQANGALLVGLTGALFAGVRQVWRRVKAGSTA